MSSTKTSRRLSAIMVADVVGYSRMMGKDETETLDRLARFYKKIVQPSISGNNGRVVKLMGDGMLAEFTSAVEAVHAALAIQDASATYENGKTEEDKILLRIGINLGDILVQGADIFGDGVNVAARLEGLSKPGGVCVSEVIKTAVGNKVDASYQYMGQQSVKNIEDPINVYHVFSGKDSRRITTKSLQKPSASIAVLPFTNMSNDEEQEYFSDGITEDIINALSYFKAIPVIARNSSFVYKNKVNRIQEIARELGARYILEGSVRKGGQQLRITTQLVDAESEHHLWAGKFDTTLDDIFKVQDEISQKIVATIQPELVRAELQKSTKKKPDSLNAWDLLLQGTAIINKHTDADHEKGRKIIRKALEIDPDYSDAWAALAWSYLINLMIVSPDERKSIQEQGMNAASRAVELDSQSSFAHYVLGVAYVWHEQFEKGVYEARLALELNPYNAMALMGLGNRLDLIGKTEEGIDYLNQGLKLSPREPFSGTMTAALSRAYLSIGSHEEALMCIEKAISLQGDNPDIHYRHALCLANLDLVEEARAAVERCESLKPGFTESRKNWKPYSDDERNGRVLAGFIRHNLHSGL